MKLYHGTTADVARRAVTEGLKPRGGGVSHWPAASHEDHVYLTTAYAGYFAAHAAGKSPLWGIVEVTMDALDRNALHPDEDFVAQTTKLPGATMEERVKVARDNIDWYQHLWSESIDKLGNVAHAGPIPPEAITRVTIFDSKQEPLQVLAWAAVDPLISVLNYRFCGEQHRLITQWLAGYDVAPEQMFQAWDSGLDGQAVVSKALKKHEGLTVFFDRTRPRGRVKKAAL